jgi:hypothetical protein
MPRVAGDDHRQLHRERLDLKDERTRRADRLKGCCQTPIRLLLTVRSPGCSGGNATAQGSRSRRYLRARLTRDRTVPRGQPSYSAASPQVLPSR